MISKGVRHDELHAPGDWDMKSVSIRDIGSVVSGGTPSRDNPEYWGGSIPWIKTAQVANGIICDAAEFISEVGLSSSSARMIKRGTILMALYGQGKTRGQVGILGIDAAINQACAAIILKSDSDAPYVYQQLRFRYAYIRGLSNTGNQENLNAEIVRSITFPWFPEHQRIKIASVLSTWDEALEKLDALIQAKEQRKKALMQQLLTGKKRLKGFTNEWGHPRMRDLVHPEDRYVKWDDDRLHRLAGVRRNAGGLFFRAELTGSEIKVKTCKKIRTGDFLVSRRQLTYGGMAMVPPEFDGFDVNDEYEVLAVNDANSFDMRFFNYLSQTKRFKHLAYLASNGFFAERLRLNLNLKVFLNHRIRVPSSFKEQIAIVEALDSANKELRLLRKQRDAIDRQKRGLMQRLLTGKIGVKV